MLSVLEAVEVVEALELSESKKRIPDHLKDTRPYSANALWGFYERTLREPKGDTCPYCHMFDGQTFTGDQLRSIFPDHEWVGDDIAPRVHMTLWGVDTCACLLIRIKAGEEPPNLDMWSQIGVNWAEQPNQEG